MRTTKRERPGAATPGDALFGRLVDAPVILPATNAYTSFWILALVPHDLPTSRAAAEGILAPMMMVSGKSPPWAGGVA
jgi:hypothetical protein